MCNDALLRLGAFVLDCFALWLRLALAILVSFMCVVAAPLGYYLEPGVCVSLFSLIQAALAREYRVKDAQLSRRPRLCLRCLFVVFAVC